MFHSNALYLLAFFRFAEQETFAQSRKSFQKVSYRTFSPKRVIGFA
jgi:hypothetical protein